MSLSFLDYTGAYTKSGDRYTFKMKNNKKKTSKFFTLLSNPTYDNSFKNMFCEEKSILKSFLNSVLFPKSNLIEKIEFSKTCFAGKDLVNNRYGYGTKNIDVGCKLFLKKNNKLKIKDNIIICDVEMQIGFSNKIEQRFIDYANRIRVDSHYSDTWVVSFILKESLDDDNFKIELKKINSDGAVQTKEFQAIKLIEISLNYCNELLKNDEDIEIIEGEILDNPGKEWIKMLCIPLWCETDRNNDSLFILPDLKKTYFECKYLRKAMEKIVYKRELFDLSDVDEHYDKMERKEYAKMEKENIKLKDENAYLKKYIKEILGKKKNEEEEIQDDDDEEEKEKDQKVSNDIEQEDDNNEESQDKNDKNIIKEDNKMDIDSE